MSQEEKSNWRDNYFPSNWHRAPRLPENMFLTDLDGIEWRKNDNGFLEPRGFFEYKKMYIFDEIMEQIKTNDRLHWQLHLVSQIAWNYRFKNVYAWFVGYQYGDEPETISDIKVFNISLWKKGTDPIVKSMNEWEFMEFLQNL